MKITIKSRRNLTKKGGEKRMKYPKIAIAFVVAGLALGTYITSQAAENVRNSKHNLSLNPNIAAQGTTEVCIFCHTPHGSDTSVAGPAAPIWNRNMSGMTQSANFTAYTSPNFDAIGLNPGKPKGVSLACLSCHDGSIAFDSLINFPGSGSIDRITFNVGNNVDAQGHMKNNPAVNSGAAGEYPMLGTNLSNDHPISMEIPCGADPQFDKTLSGLTENQICNNLETAELNAGRVSPLYRGAVSNRPSDKRDRIRAYPSNGDGKAYIECASCHNPHEENNAVRDANGTLQQLAGFTGTPIDSRFLRLPSFDLTAQPVAIQNAIAEGDRNAGSLICLSCHQK